MNVLGRCCFRSLKENRKRTAVTIVGVILATALITAVVCLVVSFRSSMILYVKQGDGDFHYRFLGVEQENLKYFYHNRNIEKMGIVERIGYALLEGSQNPDKPYLYISALDDAGWEVLSLQLAEGRMPENDTELVIGRHIRTNGLVDLKVGDVLTLQIGSRMSEGYALKQHNGYLYEEEALEPAFRKSYTIVGIIERPSNMVEERIAPGYSAFTLIGEEEENGIYDVYATYTHWGVRHGDQVTAGLLGVSEELYQRYNGVSGCTPEETEQVHAVAQSVNENYWLLRWELLTFSSGTMNMLYAMSAIAILVIIVTSVLCIRNSFVISLTEKMKMYGRLASVGTTSGQQKKIVYYEASFLGCVGIPLGILSGIAATRILIWAVGGLVEDAADIALVFDTSAAAILLAALLAAVTIFFSAAKPARKAARLSPISAIRANDEIKTGKGGLGCPGLVRRIFGIGGTVAYKNLKRARVKYRTTVLSIVVSVAVLIGLTTFTDLMFLAAGVYYEDAVGQLKVSIYGSDSYENALKAAGLEGVKEAEIVRRSHFAVSAGQIPYTQEYREYRSNQGFEEEGIVGVSVRTLGDQAYARYCESVGVSVEEAEDKAIVISSYKHTGREGDKIYVEEGEVARYYAGDVISGVNEYAGLEIQVLIQTAKKPAFLSDSSDVVIIVSDAWLDAQPLLEPDHPYVDVWMWCEDADEIERIVRSDLELLNYNVTNYDASYRANRSMYLLVAIFLYGFITVVALIGITNIINTITTNMELRVPEFAMLRAVGMTGREFRRMIWLESLFYGGKALIIGIPLGVLISFCFHRAFGEGIVTDFRFPWSGILTAFIAVAALLFGIMRYSMGKINKKDIIETIRNENI